MDKLAFRNVDMICDGKKGEAPCGKSLKVAAIVEVGIGTGVLDMFSGGMNMRLERCVAESDEEKSKWHIVERKYGFPAVFCPDCKEQAEALRKKLEEDEKAIKPEG